MWMVVSFRVEGRDSSPRYNGAMGWRGGGGTILTGWICSSSEGSSLYDLAPPLGSTTGVGRSFGLDLSQRFTRVIIHTYPHKRPYAKKNKNKARFVRNADGIERSYRF